MKKTSLVIHTPSKHPLWRFPREKVDDLKRKFPQLDIHLIYDEEIDSLLLENCEILVTGRIKPQDFKKAKNLKWIHSPFSGVGNFLFTEFVESNVLLTNSRGVNAIPVVEHILGLMFSFSRYLYLSWKYQKEKIWAQEIIWSQSPLPRELAGSTLGIIGLGEIGRRLAERAKKLEMRVLGIKKNINEKVPFVDIVLPLSQLDFLLNNSDYVVLVLPRTRETEGLMDYKRFKKMKKNSIFINVSRGKLVKEKDLIRALKEGLILAAGLDVFEEEPLPQNSELFKLPNVIITPHIAGVSPNFWDNVYKLLSENIERFLKGLPLINLVNKKEGY
ncbi:D-2-hydroxyacid dehydrogenase [SCandidatus Aminicenantes bacterium Aminicenantia_JdfR_composite]|jgi:phosphoglycerate dehydrogenase-like enzyme|nr:D-2-hydroxyacid dehydrogenase [SCandidatus Aminicenantes bacterium Aminicenantia_JdfR_composite]MCP2596829.1 D-2-hydroxyacid dehydrogenase [Candidatus Aminicenantes bacterium AC-335-G13]